MRPSLRTAVSLVLLAVLSGAPAAAVICAGWCARPLVGAPSESQAMVGVEQHAHHGNHLAVPTPAAPPADCHGAPKGAYRMGAGQHEPECAVLGAGTAASPSLNASRSEGLLLAADREVREPVVAPAPPTRGRPLRRSDPLSARPVSSSLVLRI